MNKSNQVLHFELLELQPQTNKSLNANLFIVKKISLVFPPKKTTRYAQYKKVNENYRKNNYILSLFLAQKQ